MKIAAISDLHYDETIFGNKKVIDKQPFNFFNPDADILLILGDVCNGTKSLKEILNKFSGFNGPKAYLPGNHELWIENGEDSIKLYKDEIYKIAKENGFHYLPSAPIYLGGYAFVGDIGWCDFSFRIPVPNGVKIISDKEFNTKSNLEESDYEKGVITYRENGHFIVSVSDCVTKTSHNLKCKEFTNKVVENIKRLVSDVPDSKKIILLNHFIPSRKVMIEPHFFNSAYNGSVKLEEILENPKIITSIFGHQHRPADYYIDGKEYHNVSFSAEKPEIKIIKL